MNLTTALARLLIFPGLLFAIPSAWFLLWVERKSVAALQQRIGPPLLQPMFDFIKLMGKQVPERSGVDGLLMRAWPIVAVSAAAGAVGLLPVLPASGGFAGDFILFIALLEIPPICLIAAGFSSRSLFGAIGSVREAVLTLSYNLVFLLAVVSLAAARHTFRLESIAQMPFTPVQWLCLLAMLVCLPARLHVNPFSLPNAEQEIYSGPMTEYAGGELALWQLSHGLEWVAGSGLIASLAIPHVAGWPVQLLLFLAVSLSIVLLLSAVTAATARLAIDTTVRFYWQCAIVFVCLLIIAANVTAEVVRSRG